MPAWEITEEGSTSTVPSRDQLQEQLRWEQENNLLLQESMADLELALEDKGWRRIGGDAQTEFSPDGRKLLVGLCRIMATQNPLIKRGLLIRIGYVWGQGVQVNARAGEEADQDVNAVVQRFWDDNKASLTGSQAQEENERSLGTDGEIFIAAFTSPLTGRVQARTSPAEEITDVITNPDDRDEPWFYIRTYTQRVIERGTDPGSTRTRGVTKTVAHPALGYRPGARLKSINGAEIRWDAPMLHIPVNRLDGWLRGMPDVYAAIAWARAYKDFLTDWALVTKSLATFAWRAVGKTKGRAQKAAAEAQANASRSSVAANGLPPVGGRPAAGQLAAMDEGTGLEAIPKSGAHIDADSGKQLAGMAAAGLGVPVTMLLADPGTTGARAVAETLDLPTILEMSMRRSLWEDKLTELLEYVIDQSVMAPRGALRGTAVVDDWGRRVVTLASDVEKTIEWEWPPLIDIDPVELIKALVQADSTGKVPPLIMVRQLLHAIGVKDVDEVMKTVTDPQGNWIDLESEAGQAAVEAYRASKAA